jgi:limonene 1,2-monooxygenase
MLQHKQGEFGAFLHQCHDWADWEATKRSYELYARYVIPHFARSNANRNASYDWWREHSLEASGQSRDAAAATFEKFKAVTDKATAGLGIKPFQ